MSSPLSDNQERLMVALRRAPGGELTTREAGNVRDKQRKPIGADNARKALGRLEDRDLVAGAGAGMDRRWQLQSGGVTLINDLRPPADNEGDSPQRPYYVLEEVSLHALLRGRMQLALGNAERNAEDGIDVEDFLAGIEFDTVYVKVATVDARNGTHAYRQVGKAHYRGKPTPTLVAVADRMFKPRPVHVSDDPSVSVG